MIIIKLGYVRGIENSKIYNMQMEYLENLNVEKVFHERNSGNLMLNEMINYARKGDTIFIYSIDVLGKNIKTILRFIVSTKERDITLHIKKEKFDSESQLGIYALNILKSLDDISDKKGLLDRLEAPHEKGRIPRELADLEAYKNLVEKNEMTVVEACHKLNIGRTTYYRRCKQLKELNTEKDKKI